MADFDLRKCIQDKLSDFDGFAKKSFENGESVEKAVKEAVSDMQNEEIGHLKKREGDKPEMEESDSLTVIHFRNGNRIEIPNRIDENILEMDDGIIVLKYEYRGKRYKASFEREDVLYTIERA